MFAPGVSVTFVVQSIASKLQVLLQWRRTDVSKHRLRRDGLQVLSGRQVVKLHTWWRSWRTLTMMVLKWRQDDVKDSPLLRPFVASGYVDEGVGGLLQESTSVSPWHCSPNSEL